MANVNDENVAPAGPAKPDSTRRNAESSLAGTSSSGSNTARILRNASTKLLESSPPSGMCDATGKVLSKIPTLLEIRRGSFSNNGWDGPMQRRYSVTNNENVLRLSRTNSAQTPGTAKSTSSPLDTHSERDDEEDFSRFFGRERIDNQRFTAMPKPKKIADPLAIPDDDEFEAMEDDDFEKPALARKLPNKFLDPSEDVPSLVTQTKQLNNASPTSPTQLQKIPKQDPLADPDDSFPNLYGRGEMTDQSYVPHASEALPKKFADPSADAIPYPHSTSTKPLSEQTARSGSTRPSSSSSKTSAMGPNAEGIYPNGYKFPPKNTWGEATLIGLKGLWKFTITPLGFLIVLYGLNVVAWGGMLFLLLIGGGSQYMCYPAYLHGIKDCNDLYSPRRIWIEIDSQILNALFCVTGFGLIPWRFRDLYYLLQYRVRGQYSALRKLAGINRTWFRLEGSSDLPVPMSLSSTLPTSSSLTAEHNPSLPLPVSKTPNEPLTGIRAPPTKLWRLDFVIWAYVLNTFLQAVLSGFMWGYNRFERPSWSTGTFVALACIVAGLGGLMVFVEGKRVKTIEGIPVEDGEVLADVERGVEEKKKLTGKKKGTVDEKA